MVTQEQALVIAKAIASKQGWPWLGDVSVQRVTVMGRGTVSKENAWYVRANATGRGSNIVRLHTCGFRRCNIAGICAALRD